MISFLCKRQSYCN